MALATPISGSSIGDQFDGIQVFPSAMMSRWLNICTDPTTYDGASNGAVITSPYAISRAAQRWYGMKGRGTTVLVRLRYKTFSSGSTPNALAVSNGSDVWVQVFGRDWEDESTPAGDYAGYERLYDATGTHTVKIPIDATNDVKEPDGLSATRWVEFDANCLAAVMVCVNTALNLVSNTSAALQIRVKN